MPRYPGWLSECYFYFGLGVLLLYVEVLLPEVEVALGELGGVEEIFLFWTSIPMGIEFCINKDTLV